MKAISIALLTSLLTSSLALADVRQDLSRLYPEQSSETLQKRINSVKNPKDFFRSFGPYFYWRMMNGPFRSAPWNQARQRVGWCLGDAHPENFGTLLTEKGRASYVANDIDDAHPCPLAADLLRFLTGWNLWLGEGTTDELLATYLAAKRGSLLMPTPPVVNRLLVESEFRGTRPDLKWYHPQLRILRQRSDLAAVPSPFGQEVAAAALKVLENKARVIQVAERIRIEGGSGGVKRFIVLLDRGMEGPLLLEFKEIVRPSTFPWGIPLLDPFLRVQKARDWLQKDSQTPFNGLVTLFNRPFLTRPMWEGHLDLKVSQLNGPQTRELANYQAFLLGYAHRTGTPGFGMEFETIPLQTWEKAVADLTKDIQRAYLEVKKPTD